LTTLGKIVGGGLPLAAYGGRADIMQKVAPLGPVYQAGTLSGNPLAVAAGLAMLGYLSANHQVYDVLEARAAQLSAWTPPGVTVNRVGSMFTFFFNNGPVTDWDSAKRSDTQRFAKFFHFMLEHGVYLAPSQYEAGFVSAAHSEEDIRLTVEAARGFFNA
jgi:glutamate-1-semialdehyde 2,1-aminomutase